MKVRSDREPILMGPIPRVQFNPPDDLDAGMTATPAAHIQETTSGTTTQSAAEGTRVRLPEAEAEGAPRCSERNDITVPVTTTAETTSQSRTASSARALVERVANEAGEDSQLVQIRPIAALVAEVRNGFLTSHAKARARNDSALMRKRAEQHGVSDGAGYLECAAAKAFAASLLELHSVVGVDGMTPAAHEVEGDFRHAGLAGVRCAV